MPCELIGERVSFIIVNESLINFGFYNITMFLDEIILKNISQIDYDFVVSYLTFSVAWSNKAFFSA